jgi:hypothetical protein
MEQGMTLPDESKASVLRCEAMLDAIIDRELTPGLARVLRQEAARALHHFPFAHEIDDRWPDAKQEDALDAKKRWKAYYAEAFRKGTK